MIDEQDDINVLEAIYTLLQKTNLNPVLKTKLTGLLGQKKILHLAGCIQKKGLFGEQTKSPIQYMQHR